MSKAGMFLGPNQISEILPIGYPMLMIDCAQFEEDDSLVGLRALTMNELVFQGHFPNHPILPGVLQVEAMKQLGQIGVHDKFNPTADQEIYMKAVEKVKFRRPNHPGDRMKITAKVVSFENGEAVIDAKTYNASGLTCQASITLAVREKTQPTAMPELYTEFDKTENSPVDVAGLMNFMPHRYPFLFTDYVAKQDQDSLVSVKNLSINEEFFQACPANYKTMPESLMCEVMAQSGCACVLSRPENEGKIGYFMSIESAEFFAPAFPGDQLTSYITLPPAKSRFGKGSGEIRVGDKLIMKITLMFAIVDA